MPATLSGASGVTERRVGIGFIGAGGIARQRHLPGLRAIPGVELVAVANRRRETAESVANEWGFGRVEEDWRAILQLPEVDAVFIAAPPYLHKEATVAALAAGKHVFCQARMARDYAEARAMYDAAERSGKVAMLCPPPHAMAADYVMKRLLQRENFVGRPLDVHVYGMMGTFSDPAAPLHWRQDADVSGYNTLFLGMFVEVLHRWLGYHRRVQAITAVHNPRRARPGTGDLVEVRVADSVAFATELENGAVSSWHITGIAAHPQTNRFEIYGTDGTLIVEMGQDESAVIRGGKKGEPLREIPIPADERRVWQAEADFIRAVRHGGSVSPSFLEGLKYMEVTEAVYRSSREGRAIELPLEGVAASSR